jgi:hypothetical protein
MPIIEAFGASRVQFAQIERTFNVGDLLFQTVSLPFNMEPQTQTNWCWAATAKSVSQFYFALTTWTQCKIASAELGLTCCVSPVPSACNVSWYLDRALTRTHNFVSIRTGTLTYSEIRAEIRAGRPVGARIGWSGGGGHFMVIYGCSRIGGTIYVDIDDPIYGKSHPTLDTFTNSYQGSGSWMHSYFTQTWPEYVKFKLPPLQLALAELIHKVWPLLAIKRGKTDLSPPADAPIGIPHYVYALGLDQLSAGGNMPSRPVALRVFELDPSLERPQAVFDLSADESRSPEVQTLTDEPAALELLGRGLTAIAALPPVGEDIPEMRFLRIPALYVDAFWLHYDDDGKHDLFVPIRAPDLLPLFRPLPLSEFLAPLQSAASRRGPSRDDTIAP